jgi:hypothetical protein
MFRKGYSDQRSDPQNRPLSVLQLGLGLGSLTKRFLRGGLPVGNFIRYGAHNVGRYFGSYQRPDNTPEK